MPHLTDAGNKIVELKKGDVLYNKGDECRTMFLLREGKIALYLDYGTEKQFALVTVSRRGSSLGEMGLLESENRNATAVALEDSVLVELDMEHFPAFIAKHPDEGVQIIKDIAHRFTNVVNELKSTQEVVSDVMKEIEEGRLIPKKSLKEKIKAIADLFLDVPKDVPPDLYMSFYTRTHGHMM